jgi:hypothetical protein
MLRAFNTVSTAFNFYEDGTEVETPPCAGLVTLLIITMAPPMTERTIILMPFISPGMDSEVAYTILIIIEICIFYDNVNNCTDSARGL